MNFELSVRFAITETWFNPPMKVIESGNLTFLGGIIFMKNNIRKKHE